MDRKALIAKLAKCQYNPIQDVKALEAFSDEGLSALETHCATQTENFKALQDEIEDVKLELKTAQEATKDTETKLRSAEAEVRRAKKAPTEEEWIAAAPPSIKTLLERQKKQDEEKREFLVEGLKTAQQEYSEDELKAMPIEQLERFGRVFKVEHTDVDFSAARKIPRAAAAENDVYANPPNPYGEEAIKKHNARFTN